ncbi:hypothetical protein M8C21_033170 [Ambrosia artemisiifolia]|uniref:Uncharacterized protein n=1 Tax=Ambrosia artemisiifolia TaxID=4212 RepID=A0AAD5D0S0_AMBAR|nr:hypothetical protein M8C21_033170 [Ambrosia artemisiifolia]
MKVTNNLIPRIVLGQRCSENAGQADNIRKLVKEITQLIGAFNPSDSIRLLKRLDVQGIMKRAKDVHIRYDALIEKIVKEHEEARKEGKQSEGKDLLNILLDIAEDESMEKKLTRENIKSFILNIFVAGTDNSAITTEWALSELINHPNVMEKARQEIDHVVGKNRLLQESDIPNLPYLQAIIKETLRLHPPVPMIPRKSIEHSTCFEWKAAGKDGNVCSVDMDEGIGLSNPRANPLLNKMFKKDFLVNIYDY